jgi:hypothetical protein
MWGSIRLDTTPDPHGEQLHPYHDLEFCSQIGDDPDPSFSAAWTVDRPHPDAFMVKDANGIDGALPGRPAELVIWAQQTHVR